MKPYIFIVGKVDPLGDSVRAIRKAGYRVGLFHDIQTKLKDASVFDIVIPLDFTDPDLPDTQLLTDNPVAGLLCTYENYVIAKARLAEKLRLPSLSVSAAMLCTDKVLMRQAFTDNDAALSIMFRKVTSANEALIFAKECGYPVIIKPTNLVKSLLVIRCDNEQQLVESFTSAFEHLGMLYKKYNIYERQPGMIIEQFLEGKLYSVAAFADGNGNALVCPGITELINASQVGFEDNFLYRRTLPAQISEDTAEQIFSAARRGISALGLKSTPAHVELIHTTNGEVKIIEIGARIGGYRPRMYELSYNIDLLAIEVAIATGDPVLKIAEQKANFTAVYELFPHKVGPFNNLSPEALVHRLEDHAFSFSTKMKHQSVCGPAKEGYKAAAVIIVHESDSEQFKEICAEVEEVEVTQL